MRHLVIMFSIAALSACSVTPAPDPEPDAGRYAPDAGPLQSCAMYGSDCPDVLCTKTGRCQCTLPDGMKVECERGSGSGF